MKKKPCRLNKKVSIKAQQSEPSGQEPQDQDQGANYGTEIERRRVGLAALSESLSLLPMAHLRSAAFKTSTSTTFGRNSLVKTNPAHKQ